MCRNLVFHFLLILFVDSFFAIDENIWHSYQFESGYGNRKELSISKVDAVDSFKTQENVLEWNSVSLKNRSIALGLTRNGITVLEVTASTDNDKSESFVTNELHLSMNSTVIDANIFKYWNEDSLKSEIIAVIAVASQHLNNSVDLLWYRLTNNNTLVNFWKWHLQKKIVHLNIFKLEPTRTYNILIANDRYENYSTVDWYEFHIGQHNDFWLKQAIRLQSTTNSSAISTLGAKTLLSIPQPEQLRIFELLPDNSHFIALKNLSMGHVSFVTSFKVGFDSYIAIDGDTAGIYKFSLSNNNLLEKQIVEHANLNGVDFWLSMPITTDRDELILMAERTLDFATHQTYAVQVIIHHAGKFVLHDEMTCDYYGEISNGMNCLVEEDNSAKGIKGSAFLFVNRTLGVLVPMHEKGTGLFVLHTEIIELKSPLQLKMKEFDKKKEKLEEKINRFMEKEQGKPVFPKKTVLPAIPASSEMKITHAAFRQSEDTAELNIDELTTRISKLQEKINNMSLQIANLPTLSAGSSVYDTLILNGEVEIQGTSNIRATQTNVFNGLTPDQIVNDIYSINNEQPIRGHKKFTNLQINSLEVETINNIPADTLLFTSNPLIFNGDFTMDQTLVIDGNIQVDRMNGLSIEEDIIYIPSQKQITGSLLFENLKSNSITTDRINKFPIHHNYQGTQTTDNTTLDDIEFERIFMPGNLNVETINGENFNSIIQSLCLKNIDTFIPGRTIINGDVFVQEQGLTQFLNDLQYPQEYVLAKANGFSKITANKNFTNELFIHDLTVMGKINDVDTNNVITLSADQEIKSKITFAELKVTDNLKVDGEVFSSQQDTLLPKPTLLDHNVLNSNFIFKKLEVTGTIIIENNLNESNLAASLSDVIYTNEQTATITSIKQFREGLTVLDNLEITSNSINDVKIDDFVTKDTKQTLHINQLNGNATFENVLIQSGHVDGINIVALDQESVKLSGEQFITSEIIFEEQVNAQNIDILNTLNEVPVDQYLYIDEDIKLDALNIDELTVENLIVKQKLDTQFSNFDIQSFDERRFSLNRAQAIQQPVFINQSRIQFVSGDFLNGYAFDQLFDVNVYNQKVMSMLFSNKLTIKELVVNGSVVINHLNDLQMEKILQRCIFTKEGEREPEMSFENLRLQDIQVETFNDIDFLDFKDNLVYVDEKTTDVKGVKAYLNGFHVKNYIQTSKLNSINVHDILRKNSKSIASTLVIDGNVTIVGDAKLAETFNEVAMEYITNSFNVVNEDTYKIDADVVFMKGPIIENLEVQQINAVNIDEFLGNLVYLNGENQTVFESLTFEGPVHITGNLHAGVINGIDLTKLNEEVILLTQDTSIDIPVHFDTVVTVTDSTEVETDIIAKSIKGVNISEWNDKALFINRGKISTPLKFESAFIGNNLIVENLNDINMSTLIPLKFDQTINGKLRFKTLSSVNGITVEKLVNGVKLLPEYQNTVLTGQNQRIEDNVIFQGNALIHERLDVFGRVNEHDLGEIVTLDEDQVLNGTYNFIDKLVVSSDVAIGGLLNGINLTSWVMNALKKNAPDVQTITQPWTLGGNLTFEGSVAGDGLINGWDIRKMADDVEYRRLFKQTVETDIIENYEGICQDVNKAISITRQQIYSFKYLDYKQFIELNSNIQYVHQFEHESNYYLLINDASCSSKLFVWMRDYFRLIQEFETGGIEQLVTVHDGNNTYLVTRNKLESSNCSIDSSNIWKFEDEKLILVQMLEDPVVLLQTSQIPGTFYLMDGSGVMEYKISGKQLDLSVRVVQKWTIPLDNAAFLPPGLKTGLAIRNGKRLYKLTRQELSNEDIVDSIVIGNFTIMENKYIPGRDAEILLMQVGSPRWRTMMAVAAHEETSIKRMLDFIKIYEDPLSGRVLHKVPTYKPSSMISLEFGDNGETLLIFLENQETLQIYEYKGIEGFKFRAKAQLSSEKLIPLQLPCGNPTKALGNFIGVMNKQHFTLLEAVMDGNQLNVDNISCSLT